MATHVTVSLRVRWTLRAYLLFALCWVASYLLRNPDKLYRIDIE